MKLVNVFLCHICELVLSRLFYILVKAYFSCILVWRHFFRNSKEAPSLSPINTGSWDSKEGTLRPQNQSEWTAIDVTFDQVLTSVRSTTDIAKCKSVIDNSLATLDNINSSSQAY